jgi:transmembrane sensor
MADQRPIDDALLAKFLAGETDPGESARVQQWLASQNSAPLEPSQDDFAHFERIWQDARPADTRPIDTESAWQSVQRKMRQSDTNAQPVSQPDPIIKPMPVRREDQNLAQERQPQRRQPIWNQSIWRVAAMLLLTVGVGWMAFRFLNQTKPVEQFLTFSTTNRQAERILPDGTKILLNRHSTLRYPATFNEGHRDVTLTGEAFFDVMPDAQRPFRIQARQTSVQVLGTSFNVRAYDANVSVAVRTGKVRFASKRKAVLLTKNQQATFEAKGDTIRRSLQLLPNEFAYKTGQLVFDNEPLREVVQTLNRVYDADVRLGNQVLGDCRLTTRFTNATLDAVVVITAETLKLKVRHVGKQVILDGTCQ